MGGAVYHGRLFAVEGHRGGYRGGGGSSQWRAVYHEGPFAVEN